MIMIYNYIYLSITSASGLYYNIPHCTNTINKRPIFNYLILNSNTFHYRLFSHIPCRYIIIINQVTRVGISGKKKIEKKCENR